MRSLKDLVLTVSEKKANVQFFFNQMRKYVNYLPLIRVNIKKGSISVMSLT